MHVFSGSAVELISLVSRLIRMHVNFEQTLRIIALRSLGGHVLLGCFQHIVGILDRKLAVFTSTNNLCFRGRSLPHMHELDSVVRETATI